MTRPREDRRRVYRDTAVRSHYRPSDNRDYHRSPSNRPPKRYREEDYFYEEEPPSYRAYPEQYWERPRPPRHDPRDRPLRRSQSYGQRPMSHPRNKGSHPRKPMYEERFPLQQAKKSTNQKIFAFVSNLFFYILTIGIIVSAVLFAFSEKSDASILGHRFYQVLTDSMATQPDAPSKGFFSGDIVVVKLMNGTEVKEGEIITFKVGNDGNSYLTHRLVEKLDELNGEEGDFLVTKGDANDTNDPPIPADQVLGKVVFIIPKMGSLIAFVQDNLWLCLVCVLSTFGFFLVLKAYFLQP